MKGVKTPFGYTIVEVMIVLAISGVMFLIAANFINGKQEKTAFTQGINGMASNVQDLITQVVNGRFSDIPLTCLASGGGLTFSSSVTVNQGQNFGCTFLGKVLHVQASNSPNYEVFTVAGAREDPTTGDPITSISSAFPTAIAPPLVSGSLDLTDQQITPQNLLVTHITTPTGHPTEIGFLQQPGISNGTGGLQNGPTQVNLYAINTSTPGLSEASAAGLINGTNITPISGASICLTDKHLYGEILIGTSGSVGAGNSNQLNVNVRMDVTSPC